MPANHSDPPWPLLRQLQLLEQLGCSEFQGFHLGPPVPPATLADQLSPRGPRLAGSGR